MLGAVAAVVVVLVGVAAFVLWPRGTSDVSEDEAVEDFRSRGTEPPADGTTAPSGGAGGGDGAEAGLVLPEPGVYTFAAEGEEVVKLGPLPAQTRPLPDTVTAVVVHADDACFDWTVNLFAEHTEDTRSCIDGGTLRLASHVKHQQIGALSPTATMTCDPSVLRTEDEPSLPLECSLTLDGGPTSVTASLVGEATTGDTETVAVGGTDVTATPITVTYEVSGDLTGSWDETTWWSDSGLPVRIQRALELSGLASFTEDSDLTLTDLEPTT